MSRSHRGPGKAYAKRKAEQARRHQELIESIQRRLAPVLNQKFGGMIEGSTAHICDQMGAMGALGTRYDPSRHRDIMLEAIRADNGETVQLSNDKLTSVVRIPTRATSPDEPEPRHDLSPSIRRRLGAWGEEV